MSEKETNTTSEESTEEKQPQISAAEQAKQEKDLREKAHKFYKEELPALRMQAEYDKLHAEIAESAVRNRIAVRKMIHLDQEEAQAKADYEQALENIKNGLQPDGSPMPEKTPEDVPTEPETTPEEKPERKLATPEQDV
jgi:hypothetical protein